MICNDGKVRIGSSSTLAEGEPMFLEVNYRGRWYPVCGHYFWDNNHGAATACRQLGFIDGTANRTHNSYVENAMPVGGCQPHEDLAKCTARGNAWGNFDYRNGFCKVGNQVGVQIVCRKTKRISCTGGVWGDETLCGDGDVKISAASQLASGARVAPEIRWQGRWHPICKTYFADDNHGADRYCQMLGFKRGVVSITNTQFSQDAMPVGNCKEDEELRSCTGGGNSFGRPGAQGCGAGSRVGFVITCHEHWPISRSSCRKAVFAPKMLEKCEDGDVRIAKPAAGTPNDPEVFFDSTTSSVK